jgi:hypothetical protein
MFISKTHLDRRTFLRGVGATIALPLLDAMVPARALAMTRPAPRMAFIYFPHGAVMKEWTPAGSGRQFELGRILQPLAPFTDRLTIVSGLENRHAYGPVHAITPGTWLSATSPRAGGDNDTSHGISADQLAAEQIGRDTRLRSIEVAIEEPKRICAGAWEGQYDGCLSTTISFRSARAPLAMEFSPHQLFNKLFAAKSVAGEPTRPAHCGTSILDGVAADATSLKTTLGPVDRARLDDYLDSLRGVERRVKRVDARLCSTGASTAEAASACVERMQLMFDMIALAFRADITRVASLMMAAETSQMTYDHLGMGDSFHLLSHHQNDSAKIDKLVEIQRHHTSVVASFVRTLAECEDGDGSLLDRALILYGSNMSDSHAHDHFPLPFAVIGGGCGRLRGGKHVRCVDRTPASNLLLTLLDRAGVQVESFGDSTGECAGV